VSVRGTGARRTGNSLIQFRRTNLLNFYTTTLRDALQVCCLEINRVSDAWRRERVVTAVACISFLLLVTSQSSHAPATPLNPKQ